MYIGALVVTLAACPYLLQLDWLSQSCATAVCVWSCFITSLRLRCRKISNNGSYQILCETQQICQQRHLLLSPKLMEMPLYREVWFLSGTNLFKEGWENVEDDPRSGRQVSSTNDQNVEMVRAVMAKERRLNVRVIAEETGLDKNAVHRILTDHLHMRKICMYIYINICIYVCIYKSYVYITWSIPRTKKWLP